MNKRGQDYPGDGSKWLPALLVIGILVVAGMFVREEYLTRKAQTRIFDEARDLADTNGDGMVSDTEWEQVRLETGVPSGEHVDYWLVREWLVEKKGFDYVERIWMEEKGWPYRTRAEVPGLSDHEREYNSGIGRGTHARARDGYDWFGNKVELD